MLELKEKGFPKSEYNLELMHEECAARSVSADRYRLKVTSDADKIHIRVEKIPFK